MTLKKSSPKRMLLLLVALMLAASIGIGQAILRSLFLLSPSQSDDSSNRLDQNQPAMSNRKNSWVDEKHHSIGGHHGARDAIDDGGELIASGPR